MINWGCRPRSDREGSFLWGLRDTIGCAGIAIAALWVYRSNAGFLYAYDSAPNSLLALNALEHHTLLFDAFRGGYYYDLGAGYIFTDASRGHLAPIFPIGVGILVAPLYALFYAKWVLLHGPFPEITQIAFEPLRLAYEKDAAAVVGALSAAAFFLCARELGSAKAALLATIAFAFGTEMWTIGSQALWQHGSINLITLLMTLALLRAYRFARVPGGTRARMFVSLFVAGLCAGFLPVVRPTALAFGAAGALFAAVRFRRSAWPFVAGALLGVVPGVLWNVSLFGGALGGYDVNLSSYDFSLAQVAQAGLGLFVSPAKGLLVYSPVLAFSLAGAWRALGRMRFDAAAQLVVLLTLAAGAVVANYLCFERWWGGTCFGPRYLTDVMSVAGLLLMYVLPADPLAVWRESRPRRAVASIFALLLAASIGVQIAGANGEPRSEWSAVPRSVDFHLDRIWQAADSQIVRDALVAYHTWTVNPALAPSYAGGFRGRVLALRPSDASAPVRELVCARGVQLDIAAIVENQGTERWYGYDSGVFIGQARVRVRLFDASGRQAGDSALYVEGAPGPGARAAARGTLATPPTPGSYRATFDVFANQIPALADPPPERRYTLGVRVE
jgi:hypothetical protein